MTRFLPFSPRKRWATFVIALVAGTSLMASIAGPAAASPGALDVLILEPRCDPTVAAETLQAEILAQPGVASVNFFDAIKVAPTVAQLSPYDLVVAMRNCVWSEPVATGDSLADYEDQGGVVVEAGFDWSAMPGGGYTLGGRWITAGDSPYEVGAADDFAAATLGTHLASDPLLSGVSALSALYREDVSVTPGTREIAKWSDGVPAVAVKGDTVGINAYLGDEGAANFSGDFGRLIVNAGNVLGRHELFLTKLGTGQGTIASAPAGIECGTTCSAAFGNGTSVTLSATPTGGSSFAGWSGAGCGGASTCTVAMSAAQDVTATFVAPPASPEPAPAAPAPPAHPTPECVVPKLDGKTLKAARKIVAKADCKLGRVTKKGAPGKRAKVVKQTPTAGTSRASGSKVNVVLWRR
jgi:hypothetical protein